jgi:hypothetical protein
MHVKMMHNLFSKSHRSSCFGRWLFLFAILTGLQTSGVFAQNENHFFLKMQEQELVPIAKDILNHDSSEYKFAINKSFGKKLSELLEMPGSFDYPFDSLITLSKITPTDNSFRIFSWYIIDENKEHFYYGLIQRKFITASGADSLIVIPLHHTLDYSLDIENKVLDNKNWMGALYYKVITLKTKGKRRDFRTGNWIKENHTLYVLLGWNGSTVYSNFKMADVLTFDPRDNSRAILGAPVFFFDPIPKYRAVFQYSDNSPFRLNVDKVKRKWPRKDLEMIIFDHLAPPNMSNKHELYDYGADGSYDGLYYKKSRGGFFVFVKNVRVRDPKLDKYKPKEINKQSRAAYKKMKKTGLNIYK